MKATTFRATIFAAVLSTAALVCGIEAAEATPGQHPQAGNMTVFGSARAPIGYVQYCRQFPHECRAAGRGGINMPLTPARWQELDTVNRDVNAAVIAVTDQELYGIPEVWTYPNRYGDCEDYVLLKRLMLIRRGWAPESLLITVVWDENGEGHAILTVTTSEGDFVLDNRRNDILRWQHTGYIYEKRQSARGRGQWVWLRADRPAAIAGVGTLGR